jgi:hypothetical protein
VIWFSGISSGRSHEINLEARIDATGGGGKSRTMKQDFSHIQRTAESKFWEFTAVVSCPTLRPKN